MTLEEMIEVQKNTLLEKAEDEEVGLQEWEDSVDLLTCLIELKVRREL